MPVVVLGILLGISLFTVIPLIAEKVWKCKEEDRIAKQVDRDVKIFYPGYQNAQWEYFKKPEGMMYEWENVA